MSAADSKAAAAAARNANAARSIHDLAEQRMPGGISIWTLGSAVCVIETLSDDAPAAYRLTIRQRVWANLTGRCPVCNAVADVRAHGRSAMHHTTRCPVAHPPTGLGRYIDPASTANLSAIRNRTTR